MYEFYLKNKNMLDNIFFIFIFLVMAYVFFIFLFKYIAPFVVAALFSLMIEPLVRMVNKKLKINRGIAALLCIFIVLFLIYIVGLNLFTKLFKEIQSFAIVLPIYIDELTVALDNVKLDFDYFLQITPPGVSTYFEELMPKIIAFITGAVGTTVRNKSFDIVSNIPNFFMNLIVFIISSFFIVKDKEYIIEVLSRNTPQMFVNQLKILKQGLFGALVGYLKAQSIIMSIIGIIDITSLIVLNYPYALLMGIIIAIVDALPLFGSGFILWPWALISAITQNYSQAVGLLIIYGLNMFTRQFLEPKVLSTQIGIYPVVTLISIYAGLQIFGVSGLFIGPVLAVSIKTLVTSYRTNQN